MAEHWVDLTDSLTADYLVHWKVGLWDNQMECMMDSCLETQKASSKADWRGNSMAANLGSRWELH